MTVLLKNVDVPEVETSGSSSPTFHSVSTLGTEVTCSTVGTSESSSTSSTLANKIQDLESDLKKTIDSSQDIEECENAAKMFRCLTKRLDNHVKNLRTKKTALKERGRSHRHKIMERGRFHKPKQEQSVTIATEEVEKTPTSPKATEKGSTTPTTIATAERTVTTSSLKDDDDSSSVVSQKSVKSTSTSSSQRTSFGRLRKDAVLGRKNTINSTPPLPPTMKKYASFDVPCDDVD